MYLTPHEETQIALEEAMAKNHLVPRIKSEFRIPEMESILEKKDIPIEFGVSLLTQMVIQKRITISALIGLLWWHFIEDAQVIMEDETKPDYSLPWNKPEDEDRRMIQEAMNMASKAIQRAAEADLIDYDANDGRAILRPEFDLTPDVYLELDLYQYPLPMLVPPRRLMHNKSSGYFTIKKSVILKGGNHHEDDVCLDHLERSNKIPLRLDPEVSRMVRNTWKNLDKKKACESLKEFIARKNAFERYERTARDVMEALFMQGNMIWFTHAYDKRGRTYAQGYQVNPQGNQWNKAVLTFAREEVPSTEIRA